MPYFGGDCWNESIEKEGCVDYRYLTIITGSSTSISSTYILFSTKMQKRQTLLKGFALIEK